MNFRFVSALVSVILIVIPSLSGLRATAQIVPDHTLGSEQSVVTPNQNIRGMNSNRIDGGAVRGGNLFHSFQEFNVEAGQAVYFSNSEQIVNILTRVTGGNLSEILGTLGVLGSANLFLINPNGIVFGPEARLDVAGSFLATTADGILFENGFEFAASNPEAPPLLTINMPLGLNIRENPGRIVNQTRSVLVDSEKNIPNLPSTLSVPPGETIAFIGGEVRFEGGVISSPESQIELGGLSEAGTVRLNSDQSFSFPNHIKRANVVLTDGALVGVVGNPGGNIRINAQNLELSGGSQIVNGVENVFTPFTIPTANNTNAEVPQAEDIHINTTESVRIIGQNSGIGNQVFRATSGNAGNLTINTKYLIVQDGGQILTTTFGNGNGGNLTITAEEIELAGTAADSRFRSGLATSVQPKAVGNGGTLTINTQRLLVRDQAFVSADTFGNGNGGTLSITARDIQLVGTRSLLSASVLPGATGNGGTLTINTQRLVVQNGGQIATATLSNGNSGNLSIIAQDIELVGAVSLLATSVLPEAIGNGGTLTINTQRLVIRDQAFISTTTLGNGNGGDLIVRATDIELVGSDAGLFASVGDTGTGNAGNLTVNTQRLLIQDGAQIEAATVGKGNSGDLTVTATNIELIGTETALNASAFSTATGQAGTLTVNTETLTLRDRARIDVRSQSSETAGNLEINSAFILLDNEASLNAETTGGQGNIILNTETLTLRNKSNITTNATGEATGGNIEINTDILTAFENSDISANAEVAFGGRIIINANAIFGINFRQRQTSASDITATSQLGSEFNGTVELNNEVDPAQGLIDLPQVIVDPIALIAQDPCKLGRNSAFFITGRGGIAPDPTQELTSIQGFVEWESFLDEAVTPPVNQSAKPHQQQSRKANRNTRNNYTQNNQNNPIDSRTIIPARGWIRNENGEVILVGYDPTTTGVIRQHQFSSHQCHTQEVSDHLIAR
ncbi:MAG: S-layer family protein [Cyanobacteria bacterium J06592_8]